jgi:histidinol-phosphatase (PHP family)
VEAIEPFVEIARSRGVDQIGFAEHVYYFRQTRSVWSLPYQTERCVYDLDAYVDAVCEAKRRGLPVKLGLEVDWWPPRNHELAELLAPYPWDYLLGSVHWLGGLAVDQEPGVWAERSVEDVWRWYVDELSAAARSRLFDVLSHPDLVKIFGRRPEPGLVEELHASLADCVAQAGVAVEVSSAGLRKRVGELYPAPALLRAFRERGVPITTACDAHVPEHVGLDLDRAVAHARAAGYETVTTFVGRTRVQEPLG